MSGNNNSAAAAFQDLVNSDRKKRKHEELAQRMLSSNRRSSTPSQPFRKNSPASSLASRVGVNKRSSSSQSIPGINTAWVHDLHGDPDLKPARGKKPFKKAGDVQPPRTSGHNLSSAMDVENGQAPAMAAQGFNIRGRANPGPFVVIASNFAPGTTAEDISSAMAPHTKELLSCELVAERPTVIGEIVCSDREGAENIIAMFNNQRADGRQLYVYMKNGPPATVHRLNNGRGGDSRSNDRLEDRREDRRDEQRMDDVSARAQQAPSGAQQAEEADYMELEEGTRSNTSQPRSIKNTQPTSSFSGDRDQSSYQNNRYARYDYAAHDHGRQAYNYNSRDYSRQGPRSDRNYGRMRSDNASGSYNRGRQHW